MSKFILFFLILMSFTKSYADFKPVRPLFPHGKGILHGGGCEKEECKCNISDNRCSGGLDFPSFNNFLDSDHSEGITDERRFFVVKKKIGNEWSNKSMSNLLIVSPNDVLLARSYVHNNGRWKTKKTIANNVTIGLENFHKEGSKYYSSSGLEINITQYIKSSNSNPRYVSDDIILLSKTGKPIRLIYDPKYNTKISTKYKIDPFIYINKGVNLGSVDGDTAKSAFYIYTVFVVAEINLPNK